MPFLDNLVAPEPDRTLSMSVYRKPTDTDQYHIIAKYSVINTLDHRAKVVSFVPELFRTEIEYLREVLTKCKYPTWALDRMEYKNYQQNKPNTSNSSNNKSKGYIVIPYIQGLLKAFKTSVVSMACKHYKGNRPLKNILVVPKDKDQIQ